METWREDALPGHTHDADEVTVRIDGPAEPPAGDLGGPADGPVFVDETGRRSRRYRRIGVGVGVACGVYALVIVGTLLSGNSSAPWLPVRGPKDDGPASKVETSDRQAGTATPSAPSSRTTRASHGPDAEGEHGDGPRPSGERDGRGRPDAPPDGDGDRDRAGRIPERGGAPPAPGPDAPGTPGAPDDGPAPDPTSGTPDPGPGPVVPADPPPSQEPTPSPEPGGSETPGGGGGGGGGEVPAGYTPPAEQPSAGAPPPQEAAE